jgi:signal peptidase II
VVGERSAVRSAWLRATAVAAIVVVLDQVSKQLVRNSLPLGGASDAVPGLLRIVYTTNSGVAFSELTGSVVMVTVLACVVLALLLAFFARFARRRLLWLATGMIAGGALGNLIDRLRLGAVTDFIKLPDWPAFNVADSAITIGVIALVLIIGRGGAAGTA